MANSSEPSSSISFSSCSHISNNSSIPSPEEPRSLEIISLNKLSTHLEKLLSDSDYSDAQVVVEGVCVDVHKCILGSRSKFFDDVFKKNKGPKYMLSELLLAMGYGNNVVVGYEAFVVFLSYVYTGKLMSFPPEVSTCVDQGCSHDACRPAISFVVQLTYASSVFQVPELVSLFQRQLVKLADKAVVEDVIPILVVAFDCKLQHVLSRCIDRVVQSNLDNVSLEKELPFEVAQIVKSIRNNNEHTVESECVLREKRIKSIHKALDCDDVELVKMILSESSITLDEACALHYAVSYCNQEVTKTILDLNQADVNLRNARGYTVLHVAVMRKEPSIIVSLLSKGAIVSDTMITICKRSTRPKDYHAKTERGQDKNKDRICIDVLEGEIKRNPMIGDVLVCPLEVEDDLRMKLLYLENRVALAKLFFPSEAKVAMEIAQVKSTSEFPGSNGGMSVMDMNETPLVQNTRMLLRTQALSKTVETGRRYFPLCSQVLDNFLEDEMQESCYLEKDSPEERQMKRSRYMELKQDLQTAFSEDKAKLDQSITNKKKFRTCKSHT